MLAWLKRFFQKEEPLPVPPLPSKEEIARMMYDKSPTISNGELSQVIYSPDKTVRALLFQTHRKLYTYDIERIEVYDEEEWAFVFGCDPSATPAMWVTLYNTGTTSFYDTKEHALRELYADPYYICNFT